MKTSLSEFTKSFNEGYEAMSIRLAYPRRTIGSTHYWPLDELVGQFNNVYKDCLTPYGIGEMASLVDSNMATGAFAEEDYYDACMHTVDFFEDMYRDTECGDELGGNGHKGRDLAEFINSHRGIPDVYTLWYRDERAQEEDRTVFLDEELAELAADEMEKDGEHGRPTVRETECEDYAQYKNAVRNGKGLRK